MQTTLTRIVIVLESVSHGLSENWDEISRKARKFKGFFRPKSGDLQTKKKDLHRNWDWFFGRNRKFKRFFRPKSGALQIKKKGLQRNWDWFFGRNREFKRFYRPKSGGLQKKKKKVFTEIETDFSAKFGNPNVWGGAIFNFSQKIGLKSTQNVRFCILH